MIIRIKPSEKKLLRSEIQFLEQYINKDAALNEQAGKSMFPFLFKIHEVLSNTEHWAKKIIDGPFGSQQNKWDGVPVVTIKCNPKLYPTPATFLPIPHNHNSK